MASNAVELFLGDEQSGTDPALALIAAVPPFDVTANGFDDGESRFDHVGTGQRHP